MLFDIYMSSRYYPSMTTRTTVRLPEDLMRKVKKAAAETDRSLTAVIEDALREHLSRPIEATSRPHGPLPTDGKGGLQPGVSIDDSRALRELLDEGRSLDELR